MRFIIYYVICLYWRILSEHGQNATGRYACLQYPPRPLYDTLHRVANSCASPGERRSRDVQQCYKLTEYLTVRFDMGTFYLLAITIDAIDVIEFLMNSFLQLPPTHKIDSVRSIAWVSRRFGLHRPTFFWPWGHKRPPCQNQSINQFIRQ